MEDVIYHYQKDVVKNQDMKDISGYYTNDNQAFFIAIDTSNEELVGFISIDNTVDSFNQKSLETFKNTKHLKKISTLQHLSINPKYRQKGIGKKLVNKVLEFSVLHKFDAIALVCDTENNSAIKLYEKSGFKYQFVYDLSERTKFNAVVDKIVGHELLTYIYFIEDNNLKKQNF